MTFLPNGIFIHDVWVQLKSFYILPILGFGIENSKNYPGEQLFVLSFGWLRWLITLRWLI